MINITMLRVVLTCIGFVAIDIVLLGVWFASGSPHIESDDRKQVKDSYHCMSVRFIYTASHSIGCSVCML
jgi:hypothetical protein